MVKPTSRTWVRATAHGHEVAERAQTSNDASRIPPISPATAAIATARLPSRISQAPTTSANMIRPLRYWPGVR